MIYNCPTIQEYYTTDAYVKGKAIRTAAVNTDGMYSIIR
ncbi:hypothetical protein CMALT394_290008 [Carnobacterium maltaromaticum]|nr:hypothetical protein CMALT394_290008 [Carnobacterium maltaromaticum]